MEIKRRDLPRKNFSIENIMYYLVKAISNEKSGTYIDCGFEKNEDVFKEILDALENGNVIKKKYENEEYNLNNYYILKTDINFETKKKNNKFLTWLKEHVLSLIDLGITIFSLF